jgi:HlyD family secretion protein
VKRLLLLGLLTFAAAAGVLVWWGMGRPPTLTERSLTFANAQLGTMRDLVSATGVVEPRELVVVSSEMPGTVIRLLARVNDMVADGAELAQLDERKTQLKLEQARNGVSSAEAALGQARAAVTQAEASREAARAALRYQEELAGKGGFRSDREQAEAQARAADAGLAAARAGLVVAQAKLDTARTGLKDADLAQRLTSLKVPEANPSLGRREFLVLERRAQEGQQVGPQSGPLFVLAGSLDQVEVHAQVAEGDVNKVRPGLAAVFAVTSFGDEEIEFRAVVKEVRPLANNVKGAVYYPTVLHVANRRDPVTGDWLLRPGMTASIDIIRREHRHVWKVPSAALNFQLDEAYQNDSARARVAHWKARPDAADWQVLWTWDATVGAARPLFARIGGVMNDEPGLKDSEGNEVLEWEPGQEPAPQAPPRLIIAAPPAHTPGFFDQPAHIKVS